MKVLPPFEPLARRSFHLEWNEGDGGLHQDGEQHHLLQQQGDPQQGLSPEQAAGGQEHQLEPGQYEQHQVFSHNHCRVTKVQCHKIILRTWDFWIY